MRNILVTGCAGFIGSNFAAQYKKLYPDDGVVGIDDFSSGRRDVLSADIIFYEGSVADEVLLEKVFDLHKPEYVFHFAAMPRVSLSVDYPVLTSEVNVIGTTKLLDQARKHGVKRFIFSSSSSIYGDTKILPTTEAGSIANPRSPYAVQKYAGESFCKVFSDVYGLDTVSLRYFNVFGPGQYGDAPYSTVISAWLELLYFPQPDKKPFLEGDGSQSRDFCYIDNVVQANIKAMEYKGLLGGEIFNIAENQSHTVNQVRELIEKTSNKTLDLEYRAPRVGDVAHTYADINKAKNILGYNPNTNFEENLKTTINWFQNRQR